MKRTIYPILFLFAFILSAPALFAQCDEMADSCSTELFPFNSDGQYYRAQLFPGETAKVRVTLYEGMVYRVIPCGKSKTGEKLVFALYDKKGNLLFSNENSKVLENYYDFSFGATSEYLIVAKYKSGSGCAAVLVGYQEEDKSGELDMD